MYENIGNKIKVTAQVLGWISLISGAITWLILITNGNESYYGYYYHKEDDYIGWICLIVGILGYISSWFTFGFGQLVEDIHAMRNQASSPATQINELPKLFGQLVEDIHAMRNQASSPTIQSDELPEL